jgi:heme-degrading monooxygenase HmoA
MSVRVLGRVKVDPDVMEKLFRERKGDFIAVHDEALKRGALHHEFVKGDGEVWIVDEWESGEQFQQFFSSQPKIGELMADAGVTEPPDIKIYEIMDSPDKF